MGINTVYLHLRAFGDAYYCSQLFPPAAAVGDFDPLPILLEEAHRLHLSVHGWINPLRLQNDAGMGALSDRYQIGQWYRDSQKNGTYLCKVGDYWWLNPAYPEVRQLIADGVAEIVQQYEVDGIHLDDYFYPTTETAFDAAAQGDAAGKAVVEQYIHYLAVGVANMINIFFPEVIGLSGGVANQGENLLAPLRAAVGPMVFGNAYAQKHTRITTCTLGYHAGVIGAALLVKNQG